MPVEFSSARKHAAYYSQTRPEMLALVPGSAATVLDVGCGGGAFGIGLRSGNGTRIMHGIELDAAAAKDARTVFDKVLECDVLEAFDSLESGFYDVIIFNDILEHLVDPWMCLRNARRLVSPGGCVIASIPNMRFWPILSDLFFHGNWNYRDAGVMDSTHLRFFTRNTMRALFETTGYRIRSMHGINGSSPSHKWFLINRILGGRMEDCRFPQYAIVARTDA